MTEELWEQLAPGGGRATPLIRSPWPVLPPALDNAEVRAEMGGVVRLISDIRAVRSEMNVPPAARIPLLVQGANDDTKSRLETHEELIRRLARIESVAIAEDAAPKGAVQIVIEEATYFLPLGDVIDVDQEKSRLEREMQKLDDEIGKVEKKLANEKFISRAPAEVVEENRARLADFAQSREKLSEAFDRLSSI